MLLSCIKYIPRNMHTVFALLSFVVVIHWLIFPYPSGLLHWHCGNLTIAPVPAKQPWWIWINTSCEFIMKDCITTTKQSTTKPCAYFLGYSVSDLFLVYSAALRNLCSPFGFLYAMIVAMPIAPLWLRAFIKSQHDDVIKWKHFLALLAICAGNSPVPVNSPHKGQWRGALMFSLVCVWINGWVNNREAGDLRRYLVHYDVTVMV